jgi:F0F1-type ATP synthase assembly protein I
MEWSSRLTTIGLEMVLPTVGGYGLDRVWGTLPVFLILGMILGLAVGMWHLMQLATSSDSRRK